MAWSKEIKDKVLVKCGRHCCICHKFCGIKMELHHIKHKSEGGEETFENCIPLCFDCHADQKSYDHKHPKGTKYSREELKGHRDKWYKLAGQNLGTGTTHHLEQDKFLFEKIIDIIPANPTIWYLRHVDFRARKFNLDPIRPLNQLLLIQRQEPWNVFFDSDIQSRYNEMLKLMDEFEQMIQFETFNFDDDNYNTQCVPREWHLDQPERYDRVTKKLNSLSTEVVKAYTELMGTSRVKLGVNT